MECRDPGGPACMPSLTKQEHQVARAVVAPPLWFSEHTQRRHHAAESSSSDSFSSPQLPMGIQPVAVVAHAKPVVELFEVDEPDRIEAADRSHRPHGVARTLISPDTRGVDRSGQLRVIDGDEASEPFVESPADEANAPDRMAFSDKLLSKPLRLGDHVELSGRVIIVEGEEPIVVISRLENMCHTQRDATRRAHVVVVGQVGHTSVFESMGVDDRLR